MKGKLDHGVMEVVTHRKEGLFPLPGEMKFDCDCPDWAGMCKHVAAVLYGVGARLDKSPEMLFLLRGVNHEELVDMTAAIPDAAKGGTSRRRIAASGIADVFGIEIAETAADSPVEMPHHLTKQPEEEKPDKHLTRTQKRLAAARKIRAEATAEKTKPAAKSTRSVKADLKGNSANESPPFPEPLTGNAIRSWRLALGETQTVFASRIGVTAASISQWEKKGKSFVGMHASTLAALRRAWSMTNRSQAQGQNRP